jgi:hypothetical protein
MSDLNFEFKTAPLDEMEDVVAVFYGGRGGVGSQYVVTNRRLLIGPIDTGIAEKIFTHAPGGDVISEVLSAYGPMSSTTLWLRHIVNVRPTNNASLFKPPGLEITTDTNQSFKLGIVDTPTTMNVRKINNATRDRAVQVIKEAVETAKAGPLSPA